MNANDRWTRVRAPCTELRRYAGWAPQDDIVRELPVQLVSNKHEKLLPPLFRTDNTTAARGAAGAAGTRATVEGEVAKERERAAASAVTAVTAAVEDEKWTVQTLPIPCAVASDSRGCSLSRHWRPLARAKRAGGAHCHNAAVDFITCASTRPCCSCSSRSSRSESPVKELEELRSLRRRTPLR